MPYNETLGRFNDADKNLVSYTTGTYESSNNGATPLVNITPSQTTGMYKTGFDLTLKTDSINTIKYTLDGSTPSETKGTTYTGPIKVDKNMTVKVYAYNAKQNSGVQAYAYSLRDDAENIPSAKKRISCQSRYR